MSNSQIKAILKQLIAIHVTDYFPKRNLIRTRYSSSPLTWLRDTVHFSLNKPVGNLSALMTGNMTAASWSQQKFGILIPFDKLYASCGKQLQSISEKDTYFTGDILIPTGSVILILPDGIQDAFENRITTQDEVFRYFGDTSSPAAKKDTPFFVKKMRGIEYRVYNYWEDWTVKRLVTLVVKELGYPANLNLKWREVNKMLDAGFTSHDDHWTSRMEDWGEGIRSMEEEVDFIFIFLKRLNSKGVALPLVDIEGSVCLGVRSQTNRGLTDSKGHVFSTNGLYKDFSREELFAGNILEQSLLDISESRRKLQTPLREGVILLEQVPDRYHKTIKTYASDYQTKIKKKLPKGVIKLCPHLEELLDLKF